MDSTWRVSRCSTHATYQWIGPDKVGGKCSAILLNSAPLIHPLGNNVDLRGSGGRCSDDALAHGQSRRSTTRLASHRVLLRVSRSHPGIVAIDKGVLPANNCSGFNDLGASSIQFSLHGALDHREHIPFNHVVCVALAPDTPQSDTRFAMLMQGQRKLCRGHSKLRMNKTL